MIFHIHFKSNAPILLPISHHHILQGLIYNILSCDPVYSALLHNVGYQNKNCRFKFFTFGPLSGSYKIHGKMIEFANEATWEIRSPDPDFCSIIRENMNEGTCCDLGQNRIEVSSFQAIEAPDITAGSIKIRMLSPIVIYHTIHTESGNKVYYHLPLEDKYSQYVNENFLRKFQAAFQCDAPDNIKITALDVGMQDKYVTKYKNMNYITGWKGIYRLEGDPRCLKFLYETGIGTKNSEGFGMFRIIM